MTYIYSIKDFIVGDDGMAKTKLESLFSLTVKDFIVCEEQDLWDAINTALGYTAGDYTYYIPCEAKYVTMRTALLAYMNSH
jgi:hypothetical protein